MGSEPCAVFCLLGASWTSRMHQQMGEDVADGQGAFEFFSWRTCDAWTFKATFKATQTCSFDFCSMFRRCVRKSTRTWALTRISYFDFFRGLESNSLQSYSLCCSPLSVPPSDTMYFRKSTISKTIEWPEFYHACNVLCYTMRKFPGLKNKNINVGIAQKDCAQVLKSFHLSLD